MHQIENTKHENFALEMIYKVMKDIQTVPEYKKLFKEEGFECKTESSVESVSKLSFTDSIIDYQKTVHDNLKTINNNLSIFMQESFAGINDICNRVRLCMMNVEVPLTAQIQKSQSETNKKQMNEVVEDEEVSEIEEVARYETQLCPMNQQNDDQVVKTLLIKPFFTTVDMKNSKMKITDLRCYDDDAFFDNLVHKLNKQINESYMDLTGNAAEKKSTVDKSEGNLKKQIKKSKKRGLPKRPYSSSLEVNHKFKADEDANLLQNDTSDVNITSDFDLSSSIAEPKKMKPILEKMITVEPEVYRKRAFTDLNAKLLAQLEANDSFIFFQKLMSKFDKHLEKEKQKIDNIEKKRNITKPRIADTNSKKRKPLTPETHSWSHSKTNLQKANKYDEICKKYNNSLWFRPKKLKNRKNKEETKKKAKISGSQKSINSVKEVACPCKVKVTNSSQISDSAKCKLYWMRAKYLQMSQNVKYEDILDRITNKDILPLKSEYPRKDTNYMSAKQVKDTYLYKMMFGDKKVVENAWSQLFVPMESTQFIENKENIKSPKQSGDDTKSISKIQKPQSRRDIIHKLSKYIFSGDPSDEITKTTRIYTIMPVHVFYDNLPPNQRPSQFGEASYKLPLQPIKEPKDNVKKFDTSITGNNRSNKPMKVVFDTLPKRIDREIKIASARNHPGCLPNTVKISSSGSWCPKNVQDSNHKDLPTKQSDEKFITRPHVSFQLKQISNEGSLNHVTPHIPGIEGSLHNVSTSKEGIDKNLTQLRRPEYLVRATNQQFLNKNKNCIYNNNNNAKRQLVKNSIEDKINEGMKKFITTPPPLIVKSQGSAKPHPQIPKLNISAKTTHEYLNLEAYGKPPLQSAKDKKIWQNKYAKSTGKKLVKFIDNQPSEYKIPMPKYALPQQASPKGVERQSRMLQHLHSLKNKNDAIQSNIQKAINVIENKMVDILSKPDASRSIDAFDQMEKEVSNVLKMMKINKNPDNKTEKMQNPKSSNVGAKTVEDVSKISDELFKKLQNILECDGTTTSTSSKGSLPSKEKNQRKKAKNKKAADINSNKPPSAEEKCFITSYWSPKKTLQNFPTNKEHIVNMSLVAQGGPVGDQLLLHETTIKEEETSLKQLSDNIPDQGDHNIDNGQANRTPVNYDMEHVPNEEETAKIDGGTAEQGDYKTNRDVCKELTENKMESNINHAIICQIVDTNIDNVPIEDKESTLDVINLEIITEINETIEETVVEQQIYTEEPQSTEDIATDATSSTRLTSNVTQSECLVIQEEKAIQKDEEQLKKSFAINTDEYYYNNTNLNDELEGNITKYECEIQTTTYSVVPKKVITMEEIGPNEEPESLEDSSEDDTLFRGNHVKRCENYTRIVEERMASVEKMYETNKEKNFYDNVSNIIMRAETVYSKLHDLDEVEEQKNEIVVGGSAQSLPNYDFNSIPKKVFQEKVSVDEVNSEIFLTPFMQALTDKRKSPEKTIETQKTSPRLEKSPSYYNVISFLDTLTDPKLDDHAVEVHYPRLCHYARLVHFPTITYQSHITHPLEYEPCVPSKPCLKKCTDSGRCKKVSFMLLKHDKSIQASSTTNIKTFKIFTDTTSVRDMRQNDDDKHSSGDNTIEEILTHKKVKTVHGHHGDSESSNQDSCDEMNLPLDYIYQDALDNSNNDHVNVKMSNNTDNANQYICTKTCENVVSGAYGTDSITKVKLQKRSLDAKKRESLEKIRSKTDLTKQLIEESTLLTPPKDVSEFLDVNLLKKAVEERQKLRMLKRKASTTKTNEIVSLKGEDKESILKGLYVMVYILMFTALNFDYKCL